MFRSKTEADVIRLKKEKDELNEQISKLKLEKKMEVEEIKHLARLAEAKRDVELDQKKVQLERQYAEKAKDSLTGFHEKMEARFSEELRNFKELYKEIIARLPNVNMEINKKVR